jgi:hypothetical protein
MNEKSEATYLNNLVRKNRIAGLWKVGIGDELFDISRAYEDGLEVVVVYFNESKSIKIHCNPKSEFSYNNREVNHILFLGSKESCGSPQGTSYNLIEALEVYKRIEEETNKKTPE